ncbi:hypothetical protein ASA1KI_14180 [Opitutales bacterium ASA1]|uniref:VOC family protein n=1 Tax=Congregicoccus parvus TaxID=3081749 RepID=UPI002B2A63DE|nr:hypothetical protein ASA1KI_14180 [Opitutales bacterium ASA1]
MHDTASIPPPAAGVVTAGFVTEHLAATCTFYHEHFGFVADEVDSDRASLVGPHGDRLLLLRGGGHARLAALRGATRGHGTWLEIHVDDVARHHAAMTLAGVEIVDDPHTGPDGHTLFVARDPNGVLVFVVESPTPFPASSAHTHTQSRHDPHHRHSLHRLSRN